MGLVAFLSPPGQLVVSAATAEKLRGKTDLGLKVSESVPDDAAFVDISVADRLLETHSKITRLVVAREQKPELPYIETIAPELTLRGNKDQPDVVHLTGSFHLNLTAFGFLSFVVGLLIV